MINLLVDTYFDRVHWFILVFHQDGFRSKLEKLQHSEQGSIQNSDEVFAFTCVLLAVSIIGLQYLCPYRRQLLSSLNEDGYKLQARLIVTLRYVLYDLVALGKLESVQVCLLFGSFHLCHANPKPAWPLLGSALRIAQALGLHRNRVPRSVIGGPNNVALAPWGEEEKRCWWAFYEMDRFCSMIYGYPLNVSNQDCDLDFLDPVAESQYSPEGTPLPNLRAYKLHVSKLSVIITDVLLDLYGPRNSDQDGSSSTQDQRIKRLIGKVAQLDLRLREWQSNVPIELRLDVKSNMSPQPFLPAEALHTDIGASGPRFSEHILRMQALALKLAYENARIVTHRPLLTYRMSNSPATVETAAGRSRSFLEIQDPFRASLESCRDAALQTALIGSLPQFGEALDTYAVAFVGIQCFTAAVVLCLISSHEPLTTNSHEAKIAIRQLLAMQHALKGRSPLAAQSLKVLQRLTRLVFSKEVDSLVDGSDIAYMQQGSESSGNGDLSTQINENVDHGERGAIKKATQPTTADLGPQSSSVSSLVDNYPLFNQGTEYPGNAEMTPDLNYMESEAFTQTMQEMNQSKQAHEAKFSPMVKRLHSIVMSDPQFSIDGPELSSNAPFGIVDQEQGWIWGSGFADF